MTLDLSKALSWKGAHEATHPDAAAQLTMLNDLQGNILKGHGRRYTSNLFLRFDDQRASAAKSFLRAVAASLTSSLDQLLGTDRYKSGGAGGGDFYCMMLSATGYDALGATASKPAGDAFDAGMKNRPGLNDPAPDDWDAPFRGDVHAMILIATETAPERLAARTRITSLIDATGGAVELLNPAFAEDGEVLRNRDGNGIEHFGYVDGRSQPLALVEQVEEEKNKNGGISEWNPQIPLAQLLVPCPGGQYAVSHGSFFVFRKLEQDVRAFKDREEELETLFINRYGVNEKEIHERLGATVVGRFENGTPAVKAGAEQKPIPPGPIGVPNNFDYQPDPLGLRCPFAGHIRKTNPRSDFPDSKSHLMARRGIPYGERAGVVDGVLVDDTKLPSENVGLLFMAYQSSLEDQFEVTQVDWANNANFARPGTGIDPLIGQRAGPSGQRWPAVWGVSLAAGEDDEEFSGFVTMRGGEYFFAPSISFFKRLGMQ